MSPNTPSRYNLRNRPSPSSDHPASPNSKPPRRPRKSTQKQLPAHPSAHPSETSRPKSTNSTYTRRRTSRQTPASQSRLNLSPPAPSATPKQSDEPSINRSVLRSASKSKRGTASQSNSSRHPEARRLFHPSSDRTNSTSVPASFLPTLHNLDKWKRAHLIMESQRRRLPIHGTKAVLSDRILRHVQAHPDNPIPTTFPLEENSHPRRTRPRTTTAKTNNTVTDTRSTKSKPSSSRRPASRPNRLFQSRRLSQPPLPEQQPTSAIAPPPIPLAQPHHTNLSNDKQQLPSPNMPHSSVDHVDHVDQNTHSPIQPHPTASLDEKSISAIPPPEKIPETEPQPVAALDQPPNHALHNFQENSAEDPPKPFATPPSLAPAPPHNISDTQMHITHIPTVPQQHTSDQQHAPDEEQSTPSTPVAQHGPADFESRDEHQVESEKITLPTVSDQHQPIDPPSQSMHIPPPNHLPSEGAETESVQIRPPLSSAINHTPASEEHSPSPSPIDKTLILEDESPAASTENAPVAEQTPPQMQQLSSSEEAELLAATQTVDQASLVMEAALPASEETPDTPVLDQVEKKVRVSPDEAQSEPQRVTPPETTSDTLHIGAAGQTVAMSSNDAPSESENLAIAPPKPMQVEPLAVVQAKVELIPNAEIARHDHFHHESIPKPDKSEGMEKYVHSPNMIETNPPQTAVENLIPRSPIADNAASAGMLDVSPSNSNRMIESAAIPSDVAGTSAQVSVDAPVASLKPSKVLSTTPVEKQDNNSALDLNAHSNIYEEGVASHSDSPDQALGDLVEQRIEDHSHHEQAVISTQNTTFKVVSRDSAPFSKLHEHPAKQPPQSPDHLHTEGYKTAEAPVKTSLAGETDEFTSSRGAYATKHEAGDKVLTPAVEKEDDIPFPESPLPSPVAWSPEGNYLPSMREQGESEGVIELDEEEDSEEVGTGEEEENISNRTSQDPMLIDSDGREPEVGQALCSNESVESDDQMEPTDEQPSPVEGVAPVASAVDDVIGLDDESEEFIEVDGEQSSQDVSDDPQPREAGSQNSEPEQEPPRLPPSVLEAHTRQMEEPETDPMLLQSNDPGNGNRSAAMFETNKERPVELGQPPKGIFSAVKDADGSDMHRVPDATDAYGGTKRFSESQLQATPNATVASRQEQKVALSPSLKESAQASHAEDRIDQTAHSFTEQAENGSSALLRARYQRHSKEPGAVLHNARAVLSNLNNTSQLPPLNKRPDNLSISRPEYRRKEPQGDVPNQLVRTLSQTSTPHGDLIAPPPSPVPISDSVIAKGNDVGVQVDARIAPSLREENFRRRAPFKAPRSGATRNEFPHTQNRKRTIADSGDVYGEGRVCKRRRLSPLLMPVVAMPTPASVLKAIKPRSLLDGAGTTGSRLRNNASAGSFNGGTAESLHGQLTRIEDRLARIEEGDAARRFKPFEIRTSVDGGNGGVIYPSMSEVKEYREQFESKAAKDVPVLINNARSQPKTIRLRSAWNIDELSRNTVKRAQEAAQRARESRQRGIAGPFREMVERIERVGQKRAVQRRVSFLEPPKEESAQKKRRSPYKESPYKEESPRKKRRAIRFPAAQP